MFQTNVFSGKHMLNDKKCRGFFEGTRWFPVRLFSEYNNEADCIKMKSKWAGPA